MRPELRPVRSLWLVAALLGSYHRADAQEARRLSLDEAIRIGLLNNPTLAAATADRDAADAGRREAQAQRWPRLSADAGWRHTDNQVLVFSDKLTSAVFAAPDFAIDALNHPDPQGHAVGAVGVDIPLYTSGRIGSEIDAAQSMEAAAGARLRAAGADLVTQITEAYFGVAVARAAVEVAESALEDARNHEQVADSRVNAGAALAAELMRARVDRLMRERDLERRKADQEIANARLRESLALPPGESIEPTTPLADPGEPLEDLARYAGAALDARPEVDAARRQAEAAEMTTRSARAGLGPEVAGTARYECHADSWDACEGSYVVGVALRWSPFDRGRAARIDGAEARALGAASRRRAVENGVRLEVESAYRDAGLADRSLALAREAVKAAEEARRIDAERYAAGMLRLIDLLDAETTLVAARLDAIHALHDAVVGRTRLRRAAGLLELPAAPSGEAP